MTDKSDSEKLTAICIAVALLQNDVTDQKKALGCVRISLSELTKEVKGNGDGKSLWSRLRALETAVANGVEVKVACINSRTQIMVAGFSALGVLVGAGITLLARAFS